MAILHVLAEALRQNLGFQIVAALCAVFAVSQISPSTISYDNLV